MTNLKWETRELPMSILSWLKCNRFIYIYIYSSFFIQLIVLLMSVCLQLGFLFYEDLVMLWNGEGFMDFIGHLLSGWPMSRVSSGLPVRLLWFTCCIQIQTWRVQRIKHLWIDNLLIFCFLCCCYTLLWIWILLFWLIYLTMFHVNIYLNKHVWSEQ